MNTYIGVKMIKAVPMTRGEYNTYRGWTLPPNEKASDPGYLVKYMPDEYESWSPASVFESAYFCITEEDRITLPDVQAFVHSVTSAQLDNKTTHVRVELLNGFVQHEVSSCVKPENYNHALGVQCATSRIQDRVWASLGFVLQWALYGIGRGK